MRLNSGQPASERREGVKPRLALIRGVEAGATIADIETTVATEQLLPLNPANRRIRTRTYGGVGGEELRGSPLSRLKRRNNRAPRAVRALLKNNFRAARNFLSRCAIMVQPAGGWTNEHACFCVRADLFRSGVSMPCPNYPEIRTAHACTL